jgi:predicted acyl esterase
MIPWEGAADQYRDVCRQGGIASNVFLNAWFYKQIVPIQYGNPSAPTDPWQNVSSSGADIDSFSEEQLKANRRDPVQSLIDHTLDDQYFKERSADWSKVTVPFVSCASWAGFGLHPRGNFESFTQAASKQKWLECHPGRHEEWFYLAEGMDIQKRFFDHFLKGIDNKWNEEPPVTMYERRPFDDKFSLRKEQAWPLPSTKYVDMYLSAGADENKMALTAHSTNASASFDALGEPLTFYSAPLDVEIEITGPLAAKIFASSSTSDMDLFLTLQAFSPEGEEVTFDGTIDPYTPLAQGWLRASQRKLDAQKSLPYRPYHSHDEVLPVNPGETYELDVEIWPTHIILPAGFRLALQIGGKDFERPIAEDAPPGAYFARGSGPFLHNHPADRPKEVFGGRTTIYTGGEMGSKLLVPFIQKTPIVVI